MTRPIAIVIAALIVSAMPAVAAGGQAPPAQAGRELNLRAYTELMRRDIRSQKAALITELMVFTEQEDAKFWPIYRDYEVELSRLYDAKLKMIATYAAGYETLTDTQADVLVGTFLDIESRRTALRKKYYDSLKAALTPRVAARALQIEHQLDLLVDLQVAAELPAVPTAKQ